MRSRFPFARLIPLTIAAVLAGCVAPSVVPQPAGPVPAPTPPPAPAPRPTPTPPPPPASADWRDWPVTPGNWVYRQDDRGSIALYGRVGADADLTLRCDRGRQRIYLSRRGEGAGALTIRTSSTLRSLNAVTTGGTPPYVAVELMPRDALLDAIAHTRGSFVVETARMAPLVVPAWGEVFRVIEDCR